MELVKITALTIDEITLCVSLEGKKVCAISNKTMGCTGSKKFEDIIEVREPIIEECTVFYIFVDFRKVKGIGFHYSMYRDGYKIPYNCRTVLVIETYTEISSNKKTFLDVLDFSGGGSLGYLKIGYELCTFVKLYGNHILVIDGKRYYLEEKCGILALDVERSVFLRYVDIKHLEEDYVKLLESEEIQDLILLRKTIRNHHEEIEKSKGYVLKSGEYSEKFGMVWYK